MHSRLVYSIAAALLATGSSLAFATFHSAHGPLPSATGAPAVGGKPEELNCTLCHFSEGNNLNTPGGRVEILNVPHAYTPGQGYPLTVRLSSDSTAYSPTAQVGLRAHCGPEERRRGRGNVRAGRSGHAPDRAG